MISNPIYLFYGPDTYSAYQKSMLWRREFEKKYGDFNIHVFEGEKFTNADFCAASQSMPFLSEKKLIIIRDFLRDGNIDEQKKVAEELDEAADFCVIVFLETDMPDARTTLLKTQNGWYTTKI